MLAGVLTPLLVLVFAGLGVAYWLASRRRERRRVDAVVRTADWYPRSARIRDALRRWSGLWDPNNAAARRRSAGPAVRGAQRLGSETELPLWKNRARAGTAAAAVTAGNGDGGGAGLASASASASGSGARVRADEASGSIQIPRAVQDIDRVVRRQP